MKEFDNKWIELWIWGIDCLGLKFFKVFSHLTKPNKIIK
jgi:hypothetical protein